MILIQFLNSDGQPEGLYKYTGITYEDGTFPHQEVFDKCIEQCKIEEEISSEKEFDFRNTLDEILAHNGYTRLYVEEVITNYL